jgi:hypothetical protein
VKGVFVPSLTILAALGLELALVTVSVGARSPGPESGPHLADIERGIVRDPFPPREVQFALSSRVDQALDESRKRQEQRRHEFEENASRPQQSEHHFMGWAVSDEVYRSRIPPAARTLPADMAQLPALRFTNIDIGGERELRYWRGPDYDQWLLNDVRRNIASCISIDRSTRRVYFMEFVRRSAGKWEFATSFDKCYSCHASGPRVIRPFDEPRVDIKLLARFNAIILSYGACDFGDTVDTEVRGAPLPDPRCAGCHDGKRRGRLYAIHDGTIEFKTKKDLTMPP